jgi:predicted membrane protein
MVMTAMTAVAVIFLSLFALILLALMGAIIAILYWLMKVIVQSDTKPNKAVSDEKKATPELTEEQERALAIKRQEQLNFYYYNGDPMPKPEDKIK